MYLKLEKKFKVNHPKNNNATYTSLLNYSTNLDTPFQRWYRYKEGYSIELVDFLIKKYNKNPRGIILDPFLGSGTTVLGANLNNLNPIGYEVNPFSYFLSKVKTDKYSELDLKTFLDIYSLIINESIRLNKKYKLPLLSFSQRVFDSKIEKYIMNVKVRIDEYNENQQVKNLLLIGWLSSLEKFSNYRKSGNGLKIRKTKKQHIVELEEVISDFEQEYKNIYLDISSTKYNQQCTIYNKSSLLMKKDIENESISGIIFSPPYANCFDYTEIYKLELWFGGFVKSYDDMRSLRKQSLRSHLSSLLSDDADSIMKSDVLKNLLQELTHKNLWIKKYL
jgi:hypothetical protein